MCFCLVNHALNGVVFGFVLSWTENFKDFFRWNWNCPNVVDVTYFNSYFMFKFSHQYFICLICEHSLLDHVCMGERGYLVPSKGGGLSVSL